jgi:hypothetical protein
LYFNWKDCILPCKLDFQYFTWLTWYIFLCITGKSIYLNDTAELDADTDNEYELYVECTDGTDTTQAFLRVEITKDQTDNEEPIG